MCEYLYNFMQVYVCEFKFWWWCESSSTPKQSTNNANEQLTNIYLPLRVLCMYIVQNSYCCSVSVFFQLFSLYVFSLFSFSAFGMRIDAYTNMGVQFLKKCYVLWSSTVLISRIYGLQWGCSWYCESRNVCTICVHI